MSKLLIYSLLFVFTSMFSQETLRVTYDETFTFTNNRQITFKTILFANYVISHYIKNIDDKQKANFNNPIVSEVDNKIIAPKIINSGNSSTLIIDRVKQTMRQNLLHEGRPVILDDTTAKLDWQLLNEVKTINNFKCNKAVVNFRGRTFIAWYTTEIPISAGPWKLHGLPGLILEAADIDNLYSWYATDILYPVEEQIVLTDFDYSKYDLITMRAYIQSKAEDIKSREKLIISKMPKEHRIESSTIERKGLELIYEWETN